MKRFISAALLALLAGMLVAGCGSGSSDKSSTSASADICAAAPADPAGGLPRGSDASATLTFWGWYNRPPQAVVEGFNKLYPNVRVHFVEFNVPDTHTKLLTALNAGTGAPDISMVQDRDAPRFFDLPLADLSRCLASEQDNFPAYKWAKTLRPDGTSMTVPWEAGPVVLAYRKDVFDRYGIDATRIETWDDYIAAGKKLLAASGGRVKMLLSNMTPNINGTQVSIAGDLATLSQQNDGAWFSEDGRQVTLDNPQALQALELLKKFRDAGITTNDLASPQAEFDTMKTGTVATWIAPNWWGYMPQTNAPETAGKWSAIKLPAFAAGGARASNRGGTSVAIPEQSKHKDLAWAFLNYWLLTKEGRLASYRGGQLFEAIFKPVADDPVFNQPDRFFGGVDWMQMGVEVAAEAPPFPESPLAADTENAITQNLPDYLSGKISADELLRKSQETAQARQ